MLFRASPKDGQNYLSPGRRIEVSQLAEVTPVSPHSELKALLIIQSETKLKRSIPNPCTLSPEPHDFARIRVDLNPENLEPSSTIGSLGYNRYSNPYRSLKGSLNNSINSASSARVAPEIAAATQRALLSLRRKEPMETKHSIVY